MRYGKKSFSGRGRRRGGRSRGRGRGRGRGRSLRSYTMSRGGIRL